MNKRVPETVPETVWESIVELFWLFLKWVVTEPIQALLTIIGTIIITKAIQDAVMLSDDLIRLMILSMSKLGG